MKISARFAVAKVLCVAGFVGVLARVEAAVIYRETFGLPTTTTADVSPLVFDWVRFDNFGQEIILGGTAAGVNYTVNGRPIDVSNVNAGPNGDGTFGPYARGILYMGATPSPSLALTTEYVVDPANYVPGSIVFSFYQGNNTAPHFMRLLVRVGGAWYVSNETFATPVVTLANFGTQAQLKTITYDATAAKWLQVSFDGDFVVGETPGNGTAVGSSLGDLIVGEAPAADLAGTITAFGVYGENGGTGMGNRRIDSFTIEATPLITNPAKTITWVGDVSADWDTATANWKTATGERVKFADGDHVIFDDSTAVTTVNLVPSLSPADVTMTNVTRNYFFGGGGSISGGALVKHGMGALLITNANNFGSVQIENGFLEVGFGGNVGSIGEGKVTNNAALLFNRGDSITVSNHIVGNGIVAQKGSGTMVFGGTNSSVGELQQQYGTLVLNGVNTGNLRVTGGELKGSGTIGGALISNGAINPGDGIGTLTAGSLTTLGFATNIFELSGDNVVGNGVNDLLDVKGFLDLTNNIVKVVLSAPPKTGVPYRLIQYTGTRTGSFNPTVEIVGANRYTATLSYDDVAKTVNVTFTAPAIPAQVIYRETFGIAPGTGADVAPSVFDWARFDNAGQEIFGNGVNFSADGRPVDVANVNAGPNNDGTFAAHTNGILYLGATPSPSLAFTPEFAVDPAQYIPGSIEFSWYEGNNTAGHFFRLLVRVGGKWYASAETFATPAIALTSFGTQAQLKRLAYDPTASKWLEVNFDGDFVMGETPGTGLGIASILGELTLGAAPAANLAGTITAFGVYGENGGTGTGNRRIDSFTIEAAPLTSQRPSFVNIVVEAQQLRFSGSGGRANGGFRILGSNNIAAPIANWTQATTGNFDANGGFNVAIPTPTGIQFYILQEL